MLVHYRFQRDQKMQRRGTSAQHSARRAQGKTANKEEEPLYNVIATGCKEFHPTSVPELML